MKEMQFTAMVLTLMMALILTTMLPAKVKDDRVANRSRWWMAGALLLLTVQFMLQYVLGLRQEGVVQAVMLNLICFVPTSMLMSMSVLNLQQQGHTAHRDWAVGGVATLCISGSGTVLSLLLQSSVLHIDTGSLLRIEVAASIGYAAMQLYYGLRIGSQLRRMEHALADYYAQEQPALLRWMKVSIAGLLAMALTVPAVIFVSGWPLAVYGVFFIVAIVYLWFSLVRYIISEEGHRMKVAAGSVDAMRSAVANSVQSPLGGELSATPGTDAADQVSTKVAQWVEQKGFMRHELTKPQAAEAMQLSEQQLSEWMKAAGYKSFRQWTNHLRIDEAARQLRAHPDFNIGSIADLCGINRSHFHRLFREHTGTTPGEFQKQDKHNA